MSGAEIAFATDVLRDGGRLATATADAAAALADQLAAVVVDPVVFGRLPAADALAAGLVAFRDGAVAFNRQVRAAHAELSTRAAGTADGGDGMVRDTTVAANSGAPGGGVGG